MSNRPRVVAPLVRPRAWPGVLVMAATVACAACATHLDAPDHAPEDARGGHAPPGFDSQRACRAWRKSVGPDGDAATSHISFPELSPTSSCFVAVRYEGHSARPDPIPAGCGYPRSRATLDALDAAAKRYEGIASGEGDKASWPVDLACDLTVEVRRAAAHANARTLRSLHAQLAEAVPTYPYAAISAFGYGRGVQDASVLRGWRPGDACREMDAAELDRLDVNVGRAARAANAFHGHVAPVVIVSGGAIHSTLVEAFALMHLLVCADGVPGDAVLLDPCADHTHTNLRNTGSFVLELGGRTAYVVTEGLQAGYLEERTAFDWMGGSIDQRALRDFGYLLGSHRRASVGMTSGFWYTPYRFWAEPETGLGSFTCVPR